MRIVSVFVSINDSELPENGLNLVETCSCNYDFYDKSLENVYTGPLLSRDCCAQWYQTYWCILVLKSFKKDLVLVCTCKSLSCSFGCSEGVWGSRGIDPLILNRDTRWRWVVRFMPQVLYFHGKHTAHRIGGWVGLWASLGVLEKTNLLPFVGISHQIVQPTASYCTNCVLLASVCVCLNFCILTYTNQNLYLILSTKFVDKHDNLKPVNSKVPVGFKRKSSPKCVMYDNIFAEIKYLICSQQGLHSWWSSETFPSQQLATYDSVWC